MAHRKGRRCLYHFSPVRHRARILRFGLRPECSLGKIQRVWLCDASRLAWARRHVANHHGVAPASLDCYAVIVDASTLGKKRSGVYYSVVRLRAILTRKAVSSILE